MAALMQKFLESLGFAKLTSHHPALPSLRVCAACCANRKCSASMVPRHSHKESQLHMCLHMSPRATYVSTGYTCLHMVCTASTCYTCVSTCYMHLCTPHTCLHMLHTSTCYKPLHIYSHDTHVFTCYTPPHATHLHMLHTSPHAAHISILQTHFHVLHVSTCYIHLHMLHTSLHATHVST